MPAQVQRHRAFLTRTVAYQFQAVQQGALNKQDGQHYPRYVNMERQRLNQLPQSSTANKLNIWGFGFQVQDLNHCN